MSATVLYMSISPDGFMTGPNHNGDLWLTLHAGESENVVRYALDPKSGGQRHNDDLFSNGPLNPFGGSNRAAREMSIHAVER
jgi:hypothetical protein